MCKGPKTGINCRILYKQAMLFTTNVCRFEIYFMIEKFFSEVLITVLGALSSSMQL